MENKKQHPIFFVDPGAGEKTDNCPYSQSKEGNDIRECIKPPEGYVLSGFKLEPYDSPDHFYDGKIVAQYEKEKFIDKVKPNLMIYILALISIAGIVTSILALTLPKKPKPEPVVELPKADVDAISIKKATIIRAHDVRNDSILAMMKDSMEAAMQEDIIKEEVEKEEIVNKEVAVAETTNKEEIAKAVVVKEEAKQESVEEVVEPPTPSPSEIKAEFKKEFWALIHHQERRMSSYGKLYRKYNGKVKGSEYNYLWLTILRGTSEFRRWNNNLNEIPADEIKSVRTVKELTKLMEEYE